MNDPKPSQVLDLTAALARSLAIPRCVTIIPASGATDRECSELARAIAPAVLRDLFDPLPSLDSPHGTALTTAVYHACDELQDLGPKSKRICLQLLEALARYELALGQLLIAKEERRPGYVKDGPCDDCGKHGPLQCLTDQEQDNHPLLICLDGCAVPTYRVMWCKWENGGGFDMQEWHPSDWESTDEEAAKDHVRHLDLRFAPMYRHRYEVKS